MIAGILFGLGIGGALVGFCYVAAYAVAWADREETWRDSTAGDWPYIPEVFPPHNNEGNTL